MRILICNYEYPPLGGGGGVFTQHLAEDLAKRHDVTVLTSRGLGTPAQETVNGVRLVRVNVFARRQKSSANAISMFAYIPAAIREGKKLMRTEKFDIINTHFVLPSGPVGNALSRHAGIPNVLSVHGGDLYDPSKFTSPHRHWLLRKWITHLLQSADSVVGQSENTLSNVRTYYSNTVETARIPLGIVRPPTIQASRHEFGFTDDEVLLVTVGRLVARKAVDQLIDSVRALQNDKVRLIVIGSGPLDAELKEQARIHGVEDKVFFTGFIDEEDKFRLLEMSDLYVSTSQHEGFGLVFLEGMHCGLPVVCYDLGGQTDFLRDDETGYVVKLNDLDRFTERCRQLISETAARKVMGDHNRQVVTKFYIEEVSNQYERAFEEAMRAKSVVGAVGVSGEVAR